MYKDPTSKLEIKEAIEEFKDIETKFYSDQNITVEVLYLFNKATWVEKPPNLGEKYRKRVHFRERGARARVFREKDMKK